MDGVWEAARAETRRAALSAHARGPTCQSDSFCGLGSPNASFEPFLLLLTVVYCLLLVFAV